MSKLRLEIEALEVSTFAVDAKLEAKKELGADSIDTRIPVCTYCSQCNWTAQL